MPGSHHQPQINGAESEPASKHNPAGSTASGRGNPTVLGATLLCSQFSFVLQVLQYLYSSLTVKIDSSRLSWVSRVFCAERDGRSQAGGEGWKGSPDPAGSTRVSGTASPCTGSLPGFAGWAGPRSPPAMAGTRVPAQSSKRDEASRPASHQPQQIFLISGPLHQPPDLSIPEAGCFVKAKNHSNSQQQEQPAPESELSRARSKSSGMLVHKTHSGKSQFGVTSPP